MQSAPQISTELAGPITLCFDGRSLTFECYGSEQPHATIFYLHGFPGSRLEAKFADAHAKTFGYRLIGIDRPGFGGSNTYANRRLIDFPQDLERIANHLNIQRFAIVACSGGVPYALACAATLAERISACALVSGLGPIAAAPELLQSMHFFNRVMLSQAIRTPKLVERIVLGLSLFLRLSPAMMVGWLKTVSPLADKKILARPEVAQLLEANFKLGLAGQTEGPAREVRTMIDPWGFSLEDIHVPTHIWHGDADTYVPIQMSEYVAKKIPDCVYTAVPNMGHFLIVDILPEIMQTLKKYDK
jgi:pimeloyl-ACP methyl ester carboxylesterase